MTDHQLILHELRALRGAFNDHAANTERRLDSLETKVGRLTGTGPILVATNTRARKSRPS
jgi:hypothetical protein